MSDLWTRWQMGETIEALAKEYGVTSGRMRYRLEKLAQGRQAVQMHEALRLISISDNLDLPPDEAHARCVRIAKAALSPQPPEDAR